MISSCVEATIGVCLKYSLDCEQVFFGGVVYLGYTNIQYQRRSNNPSSADGKVGGNHARVCVGSWKLLETEARNFVSQLNK